MLVVDRLGWSWLSVSRLEDLQRFGASVPLAVAVAAVVAVLAVVVLLPMVS